MTTETNDCAEMGATGKHHELLKPFEGTFDARVKMFMGPGDPHVSTGTMVNRFELGGRYHVQDYKGHATDGPFPNFEGRGFRGYNTIDKRYEGVWIDSASTFMQNETGQVDDTGRVWTMNGSMTSPETGKAMTKRTVITLEGPDKHRMEMFFEGPDGGEFKAMDIVYTRTA